MTFLTQHLDLSIFDPNVGLKMLFKIITQLQCSWKWKVNILNDILTQHLGLSTFDPNVGLKMSFKLIIHQRSWKWKVNILHDIFNPTFGFVHIWPKFGLKQPQHILEGIQWKFVCKTNVYIYVCNLLFLLWTPLTFIVRFW